MKKFIIILAAFVMLAATVRSQTAIYSYPSKTVLGPNDRMLGTDQLNQRTVNFPLYAISNYVKDQIPELNIVVRYYSKTLLAAPENAINIGNEFSIQSGDFVIISMDITDSPVDDQVYISTKPPGTYGAGRTPYVSTDLIPLSSIPSGNNVLLTGDYSWLHANGDNIQTAMVNIYDNVMLKTNAGGNQTVSSYNHFLGDQTIDSIQSYKINVIGSIYGSEISANTSIITQGKLGGDFLTIDGGPTGSYINMDYDGSIQPASLHVKASDGTLNFSDGTHGVTGIVLNQSSITTSGGIAKSNTATGIHLSTLGGNEDSTVALTVDYTNLGLIAGQTQKDFNNEVNSRFFSGLYVYAAFITTAPVLINEIDEIGVTASVVSGGVGRYTISFTPVLPNGCIPMVTTSGFLGSPVHAYAYDIQNSQISIAVVDKDGVYTSVGNPHIMILSPSKN